jgi:hypothetical protein
MAHGSVERAPKSQPKRKQPMRVMAVPRTTDGALTSAQRRSSMPRLRQPYQLARKPPIMPP